jgi:hypothetical protein
LSEESFKPSIESVEKSVLEDGILEQLDNSFAAK